MESSILFAGVNRPFHVTPLNEVAYNVPFWVVISSLLLKSVTASENTNVTS